MIDIQIPGVEIKSAADAQQRVSMLLWGPPGAGKTVYACSAPGNKLLIQFDPNGSASLGARDDVFVMDLSGERHTVVDKFNSDDPYGLSKAFASMDDIHTVVVDSVTAYSQLAVEKGISVTKGATLERPSPGAYGARNAITLRMMTTLLRLTNRFNKHIIFTSHEDKETNDEGSTIGYTLMLGGKLGSQAALQISEVWHLSDDGKQRRVLIRPARMRKILKTRLFKADGAPEFVSKYNQFGDMAPYGEHSITSFIEEFERNGKNKIEVPK